MNPEAQLRFARALVALALVIGVVAVAIGNVYTAVAMLLLLTGQLGNVRCARRKLGRGRG